MGTRTLRTRIPFGRRSSESTVPTGSGRAAISSTAWAMRSMRGASRSNRSSMAPLMLRARPASRSRPFAATSSSVLARKPEAANRSAASFEDHRGAQADGRRREPLGTWRRRQTWRLSVAPNRQAPDRALGRTLSKFKLSGRASTVLCCGRCTFLGGGACVRCLRRR